MKRSTVPLATLVALVVGCAASPPYRASMRSSQSMPAAASPAQTSTVVDSGSRFAPPPSVREPSVDRPSARPRSDADEVSPTGLPATVPPATGSAPIESLGEPTIPSRQGAAQEDGERAVREARIGAQVQRIRDEQIRLATNPGICHDVCFAAGSICLAAQEVCRLTGDTDTRCEHARGACADAGHQRDGACPVCPPTH